MASRPRPCYGYLSFSGYRHRSAEIPEQRQGRYIRTSCLSSGAGCPATKLNRASPSTAQARNISL
ncbi:hypothetical protein IQ270_20635 [Microcoleus sp. LEGE 07076]|uniref:hypothetical protein n=1 Tax=Microcoleus sp. LEGE 07076 TaxID=915322 RepID=UPI00187F432D|nr:hypothetical protein [Microcoleus sp. LEGE 07076]MBE9186995.1 hypothetical protein [Microcoleus sp. LEGE 07076]